MTYIKDAVEEAKLAKCDTLVFVGDFNTWLHCDNTVASSPPFDRGDPKTNSSFQYIVDTICRSGICSLKGLDDNILYYDELMQMMDKKPINCFEKRKAPDSMFKQIWKTITSKNTLTELNIFEADVPDWPPTYKVAPETQASQLQNAWYFCAEEKQKGRERSCFMNKLRKVKHNPAWTDRILLWPSKAGRAIPKATAYP